MTTPGPILPASPLPPAPDVPKEELTDRLERFRVSMAKEGFDSVVLTDKKNVEYFTDYRALSWAYKARPIMVGISAAEIVLFGALPESKNVALKERPFSALFYDGYLPEAASAVGRWARSVSSGPSRNIGIDYGQDMLGRGSLELIGALQDAAGQGRVTSAVNALWQVRMIKSRFEAEQKRISFEIVNRAFETTMAQAQIGMTEYELCRLLQAQIYLNGAESADPIAMLFSSGDFVYSRPPSARRLEAGQYVWTDFRSTYGGYPADRSRTARAGEPESWEVDLYARTRSLTVDLCHDIKPGMTCAALFECFARRWADADLGEVYKMVSRIGHGGGMDVTEPPSCAPDDDRVIVPGMILHLEPKLERDGAVFQFEEVVFVTETGIEFLSALSPESLPVIN